MFQGNPNEAHRGEKRNAGHPPSGPTGTEEVPSDDVDHVIRLHQGGRSGNSDGQTQEEAFKGTDVMSAKNAEPSRCVTPLPTTSRWPLLPPLREVGLSPLKLPSPRAASLRDLSAQWAFELRRRSLMKRLRNELLARAPPGVVVPKLRFVVYR
ncbi:hypothetical protein PAPYR_5866 [Paratrimastix pyriformis]|uniref:Uncharacterized protein n=1 Tax=Paratrimastix pyriformis TaxID=342808 RepID=A0ABQ8UGT8_9EUKA|nr:hypothetical protein PAPYR_5866 [Paratrimastix pyriformis]